MKRIAARVLAFTMILNTFSISGITVYADSFELNPDTNMKNNGGGLNSAYYWGQNDPNRSGGYSSWYGFNIQGILDPDRIGAEEPYINLDPSKYQGNNTGDIQLYPHDAVPVTWDYSGFKTVIRSGQQTASYAYPITITNNGGVQKIADYNYVLYTLSSYLLCNMSPSRRNRIRLHKRHLSDRLLHRLFYNIYSDRMHLDQSNRPLSRNCCS